jgi:hypothetical protein
VGDVAPDGDVPRDGGDREVHGQRGRGQRRAEHHGGSSAQKIFDKYYKEKKSFWERETGNPDRSDMFDYNAVYLRGRMTLHVLRKQIGDDMFFSLLKTWAEENKYGTVTTRDFINLAERLSGQDLDPMFDTWLYTPGKPKL